MLIVLQAEALLLSLDIACSGHVFHGADAWRKLLDFVEGYFRASGPECPPLFLQRPAHSLTIIGIELLKCSKRRLLVFDPQWRPPSIMSDAARARKCVGLHRSLLLWRYRKSTRHLRRFNSFEVLSIDCL
jgi:hypothetical protein